MPCRRRRLILLALPAAVAACDFLTDPATRLAYDLEAGARRLDAAPGAHWRVEHRTPSQAGECTGPYTVQVDKAGALVVWCKDAAGATVSSHSTSHHARHVDTPQTWRVDKPAGATLLIELERRGGRATIRSVD